MMRDNASLMNLGEAQGCLSRSASAQAGFLTRPQGLVRASQWNAESGSVTVTSNS